MGAAIAAIFGAISAVSSSFLGLQSQNAATNTQRSFDREVMTSSVSTAPVIIGAALLFLFVIIIIFIFNSDKKWLVK